MYVCIWGLRWNDIDFFCTIVLSQYVILLCTPFAAKARMEDAEIIGGEWLVTSSGEQLKCAFMVVS